MNQTPPQSPYGQPLTNTNDNIELLKAWAGTTFAYAVLLVGGASGLFQGIFVTALWVSGVVCGLAFVLHELAHRIVARRYGAEAHFIANNGMLLVSIAIAFGGIFFAAPGAVWHRGYLTKQQSGLIALAGPVTNLVLALIFALIWIVLNPDPRSVTYILVSTGYRLNAFIGLFNMIPAGPFDGKKVIDWSVPVFVVTLAIAGALTFLINEQHIYSLIRALH